MKGELQENFQPIRVTYWCICANRIQDNHLQHMSQSTVRKKEKKKEKEEMQLG